MPHTAVGRIPSGPPTFYHRAWTMASSNVSGTLQSPPNHNPLYSPQTIPVGPHYVPVQPPPGFMGQYAPPMTDTIQTPYSGAVPYSPSPYIAHTAHSSSVPYTPDHFHLGATCLHQLMGHVAQSSQTRSTHLPVHNVAQSPLIKCSSHVKPVLLECLMAHKRLVLYYPRAQILTWALMPKFHRK